MAPPGPRFPTPTVADTTRPVPRPQFESTAHAQEHEATGRAPPSVGAGVEQDGDRFDRDYNYANVIQYDSRSQPQHWAALTKAAHADPRTGGKATEFGVAKRTKPHPVTDDPARTADYRGRWTLEADRSFAADRFTPMSVASLAPGDPARKFARRTTRALPGAPLAVESLREAAIGRAGSLALDALRGQLLAMDESGDGRLSKEEFRWAVSDFGVGEWGTCCAHSHIRLLTVPHRDGRALPGPGLRLV